LNEYTKLYQAFTKQRAYIESSAGKEEYELRLSDELWDFVQSQGNGYAWVARQSTTGRGFRLHNTRDGESWRVGGQVVGLGLTAREAMLDLAKQIDNQERLK
jgi:hypothetical protein